MRLSIKVSLVALVIIGMLVVLFWALFPKFTAMINCEQDLQNEREIAKAMALYKKAHQENLPTTIEALVNEGYLPHQSEIYASPFNKKTTDFKSTSYQNSDYFIVSVDDGTKPFFYIRKHTDREQQIAPDGYFEINSIVTGKNIK